MDRLRRARDHAAADPTKLASRRPRRNDRQHSRGRRRRSRRQRPLQTQHSSPRLRQILDAERNERIRFRLVFHTSHLVRALSLGRGAIAGDPALIPPELLVEAETVWQPSARDLIADEVIRQIATDRKWGRSSRARACRSASWSRLPTSCSALQAGVNTGEAPPIPRKRPAAAPRGMVGLSSRGASRRPTRGSSTRRGSSPAPTSDPKKASGRAPPPSRPESWCCVCCWRAPGRGCSAAIAPGSWRRARAGSATRANGGGCRGATRRAETRPEAPPRAATARRRAASMRSSSAARTTSPPYCWCSTGSPTTSARRRSWRTSPSTGSAPRRSSAAASSSEPRISSSPGASPRSPTKRGRRSSSPAPPTR